MVTRCLPGSKKPRQSSAPENTQLGNTIYSAIDAPYRKPTEWGGSNWLCYLLLDSPESARAVEDNFNRTFDFSQIWGCEHLHLRLLPLEDLHYMNMQDVWGSSPLRTQSPETGRLLFLIAWLILLIAAVNYMNFSTALENLKPISVTLRYHPIVRRIYREGIMKRLPN